jgi:phosphopentomutase
MATIPFRRVIWIVLDSVGIGEMPDAAAYGDAGSDTLGNIAKRRALHLPNLSRLGLANIRPFQGLTPAAKPLAAYGRCTLASPGKDTTTGHWEMVGIHLPKPFPTYLKGFPAALIESFEYAIGRKTLGNVAASGTEIIDQLGEEHMRTRRPIVYTSADSVFQIAAHEDVISVPELYQICEIARDLLQGPLEVGRVIARPFVGTPGHFTRTANRHDYAVPPPEGMLLDQLASKGVPVHSVGKIFDVFLGRGIATQVKTKTNADGMARILETVDAQPDGVIYANLVDFDMLFGHRNDVEGYAKALEEVDAWLPTFQAAMKPGDLAIFTADHGCDPTTPSTDHSREYVPVLALGGKSVDLGTRATLADMGQTIAENFGTKIAVGTSFLGQIA